MVRLPHNEVSGRTRRTARSLRQTMTDEEVQLWSELKSFRKVGYAFRKQAPVGPFIADFLCRKAKLVVEVDGRHHDQPEQIGHDRKRDAWLTDQGYRVLRFSAHEIRRHRDDVIRGIETALGIGCLSSSLGQGEVGEP